MERLLNHGDEILQFSGLGEVYCFTTVYEPAEGFEFCTPYTIAIIKLEEGNLITAQLTDVESKEVYIGMPVSMVTRKLSSDGDRGVIRYGYKFRPIF